MTEMHFISKEAKGRLNEEDFTLEDVKEKFRQKIEELRGKKYISERQPWSEKPKKIKRKAGRFVSLIQSNFPFKMFVLRESFLEGEEEPEIRIGYYIVSPKLLKEKGKLRLMWGQYNPNIPKKDFIELIRKAQEKGIIDMHTFSIK